MTSSAVASSVGGTVRPSAFAVLRLSTNSIFVVPVARPAVLAAMSEDRLDATAVLLLECAQLAIGWTVPVL